MALNLVCSTCGHEGLVSETDPCEACGGISTVYSEAYKGAPVGLVCRDCGQAGLVTATDPCKTCGGNRTVHVDQFVLERLEREREREKAHYEKVALDPVCSNCGEQGLVTTMDPCKACGETTAVHADTYKKRLEKIAEQEEEAETRAAVVAARTLKWDYKVLHGQGVVDGGLNEASRKLIEAGEYGWELVTFESATFKKGGGLVAGFMSGFADADNYEKGWIAVFKRPKG